MKEDNHYKKMYQDVRSNIGSALTDLGDIKIEDEQGNLHLEKLKQQLEVIHANFTKDIEFQEKHTEWEKFTLAFFGETGAGKSTILESLRIVFNEKKRQKQIDENRITVAELNAAFSERSDELVQAIDDMYENHASQTEDLAHNISELKNAFLRETSIKKKLLIYSLLVVLSFVAGYISHIYLPF